MKALYVVAAVLGSLGVLIPLMVWVIKRNVSHMEALGRLPIAVKGRLRPAWLDLADRVLFLVFVLLLLFASDSDSDWRRWGLFLSVAALAILHGAFVFRLLHLVRKTGEREPLGLNGAVRHEMISHALAAAVYLVLGIVSGPLREFWT